MTYVLWILPICLLLALLVWGVLQNKRRNRANDSVTEAATKAEYADLSGYDERRADFTRQLKPTDDP